MQPAARRLSMVSNGSAADRDDSSASGRARAASAAAPAGTEGKQPAAGATAFGRARAASAALAARSQPRKKAAADAPGAEDAGSLPRADSGASSSKAGADAGPGARPLPARARSFLKPPQPKSPGSEAGGDPGAEGGEGEAGGGALSRRPSTASLRAGSTGSADAPRGRSMGRVPAGLRAPSVGSDGGDRGPAAGLPPLRPPPEKARAGSLGERQQRAVAQNLAKLLRDLVRDAEAAAAAKPTLVPFPEVLQEHIIASMGRVREARVPGVIEAPGFKEADMDPIFRRMARTPLLLSHCSAPLLCAPRAGPLRGEILRRP